MSLPKPFQVKNTIGKTYDVAPKDVHRTKTALHATGHYEMPEWGISDTADQATIDGILALQKQHDLKPDGIIHPGGPTEQKINELLKRKEAKPVQVAVAGAIPGIIPPPVGIPNSNKEAVDKAAAQLWRDIQPAQETLEDALDKTANTLFDNALVSTITGKTKLRMEDGSYWYIDTPEETEPGSSLFKTKVGDTEVLLVPRSINGGPTFWSKAEDFKEWNQVKRTEIAPPVKPSPGLIPPDIPQGRREEFPVHDEDHSPPPNLPTPHDAQDFVLPLPITDPLIETLFVESRGNAETQAKTNIAIKLLLKTLKSLGLEAEHINGGHTPEEFLKDGEDSYKPEKFWRAIGDVGAVRTDFSIRVRLKDGVFKLLEGNTVDNLKDGRTPTKRERKALERLKKLLEAHGEDGDIIDLPKLKGMPLDEYERQMEKLIVEYVKARFGS